MRGSIWSQRETRIGKEIVVRQQVSLVKFRDLMQKKKSSYSQLSHEIHQNLIIAATFLIPMLNPHWFSRPALKQL